MSAGTGGNAGHKAQNCCDPCAPKLVPVIVLVCFRNSGVEEELEDPKDIVLEEQELAAAEAAEAEEAALHCGCSVRPVCSCFALQPFLRHCIYHWLCQDRNLRSQPYSCFAGLCACLPCTGGGGVTVIGVTCEVFFAATFLVHRCSRLELSLALQPKSTLQSLLLLLLKPATAAAARGQYFNNPILEPIFEQGR